MLQKIEKKNETKSDFGFTDFSLFGGLPSFPQFSCVCMYEAKHLKYKEIKYIEK